jgi:hypothetical protein
MATTYYLFDKNLEFGFSIFLHVIFYKKFSEQPIPLNSIKRANFKIQFGCYTGGISSHGNHADKRLPKRFFLISWRLSQQPEHARTFSLR